MIFAERSLRAAKLIYEFALVKDLKDAPTIVFACIQQNVKLQSESFRMLKKNSYLSDGAYKSASMFGSHFASVFYQDDRRPSASIASLELLMSKLEIA